MNKGWADTTVEPSEITTKLFVWQYDVLLMRTEKNARKGFCPKMTSKKS